MYKSKHTGETIDKNIDLMQYVSNPNLLDNWYFLNPVNQRGQTEYVGNGYSVDRWRGAYTNDVTTITAKGLTFKNMRSSGSTYFRQYLENLPGDGVYTLSVLVEEVVDATVYLYNASGQLVEQPVSLTPGMNTVTVEVSGDSINRVQFTIRDSGLITIVAIKLELGTEQTLAHQDGDGNWVLNEIPDYGEQLAKCQRHQLVIDATSLWTAIGSALASETNYLRVVVPTPVTMRSTPTITFDSGLNVNATGAGHHASIASAGKEVKSVLPGALFVAFSNIATSLTRYETYGIQAYGGRIIFDANL